jgi:hypothetical protein
MPDPFTQVLDDVGEEVFGLQWLAFRPLVARWVEDNPERVAWLRHRLRQHVEEGRL